MPHEQNPDYQNPDIWTNQPPDDTPPPNSGGLPTREQIAQAFRMYLGRPIKESEYGAWLGNANFDREIYNSPEATALRQIATIDPTTGKITYLPGKGPTVDPTNPGSGNFNPGFNANTPGTPPPQGTAQAFIKQWQQTHKASEGIGPLAEALKAAGFNVPRFMYGTTPSNNELVVDGQKFKVLGAEDSPNTAYWYTGGNDSGGAGGGGNTGGGDGGNMDFGAWGSLLAPWTEPFQFDAFKPPPAFVAPTSANEQNDPGYQFRLDQGNKQLQRMAAARGTVLTGGTVKDLTQFGQDYASNEFDKVYARDYGEYQNNYAHAIGEYEQAYNKALQEYDQKYNIFQGNQSSIFNRLSSLAGLGQVSANQLSSQGLNAAGNYGSMLMNGANAYGNYLTQGANANAAGRIGGANAWLNGLGNIGNLAQLMYLGRGSSYGGGGGGNGLPGYSGGPF